MGSRGRQKRYLSKDEIEAIQKMIANKISQNDIAKSFGMSLSSYKSHLKDITEKGLMPDDADIPKNKKIDDTDTDDKQDKLIKPTGDKFIAAASKTLSDDMVTELKERLTAAQTLKNAELLYRKNVESMRFNWQEWVERALRVAYEDTMTWYEEEGKKMSLEEIMEIATELETAKAFMEKMR